MGAFVLMGSGEFLPWASEPDRWAIEHAGVSSDRVVVVPAASAPEGNDVFDKWARMGIDYFAGLGLKPEVLDVRSHADADDLDRIRMIEGARYVFFSGGNPATLAATFEDTAGWKAIREAAVSGTALGGCSAGMVALGVLAPDASRFEGGTREGLRLFTKAYFGAHWDKLDDYYPGLQQMVLDAWPTGSILFAVDEETAAYGDGSRWRVAGKGALTIPGEDGLERIPAGGEAVVSLGLDLA
jgi:cyanophycinase-like exopeptidase